MPITPTNKPESDEDRYPNLKPYLFHGLDLNIPRKGDEANGTCPFCGRENKFNVNVQNTLYHCWGCSETGNSAKFLQEIWKFCLGETPISRYKQLADDSSLPDYKELKEFGCAYNLLNDKWLVPGYNHDSKMTGLYKFTRIKDKRGTWVSKLLPTPGFGLHLFNLHKYDANKPIVDICEGWRDGIAWQTYVNMSGHFNERSVISVPGTNSFKPQWGKFFAQKEVNILFDNDHPRMNKKTGKTESPAGIQGVRKVASMLASMDDPPIAINYLCWNKAEEGFDTGLADGLDIRDYLSSGSS